MDGVESGCSEETAAPSPARRSGEKHSQEGTADTADLSAPLRSVERHFQERTAGPQISPLRSFGAPVEMTKGRVALPGRAVAELKHFQERTAGPQISQLRSFGAPVEMTKGRAALVSLERRAVEKFLCECSFLK